MIANRNALWAVLFSAMALLCFHPLSTRILSKRRVRTVRRACDSTFRGNPSELPHICLPYVVDTGDPAHRDCSVFFPTRSSECSAAATHKLLGYGSAGSGMHIDPASEPAPSHRRVLISLARCSCWRSLDSPPADVSGCRPDL